MVNILFRKVNDYIMRKMVHNVKLERPFYEKATIS